MYIDEETKRLHELYKRRELYKNGYGQASEGGPRTPPSGCSQTGTNQWLAGYDYYIKLGMQKHVNFLKTKSQAQRA